MWYFWNTHYLLQLSLCQHCHGWCVSRVDEQGLNTARVGDLTFLCSSIFLSGHILGFTFLHLEQNTVYWLMNVNTNSMKTLSVMWNLYFNARGVWMAASWIHLPQRISNYAQNTELFFMSILIQLLIQIHTEWRAASGLHQGHNYAVKMSLQAAKPQ